jgi:hypothetical protein
MLIDNTEDALDLAVSRFELNTTTDFDALRALVAIAK